jgi:hypothetical protein
MLPTADSLHWSAASTTGRRRCRRAAHHRCASHPMPAPPCRCQRLQNAIYNHLHTSPGVRGSMMEFLQVLLASVRLAAATSPMAVRRTSPLHHVAEIIAVPQKSSRRCSGTAMLISTIGRLCSLSTHAASCNVQTLHLSWWTDDKMCSPEDQHTRGRSGGSRKCHRVALAQHPDTVRICQCRLHWPCLAAHLCRPV